MSLDTMCRVCLAMDVPVHILAGSPVQNVYEKLTGISLNSAHRPVVACYICYPQLWNSHSLMARSLKAEEVLTQFLQSSEAVQGESIRMLNQKTSELRNALSVTPTQIIDVTSTDEDIEVQVKEERTSDDNLIAIEIKEEPMTSECIADEEIFIRSADRLKFEQSEDEEDMSREELEYVKVHSRTAEIDIKQEELRLSNCATHVQDISTEEMICCPNNKNEMLSLPLPTVVSVDWQREENIKSNAFEDPGSSAPVNRCENTVLPLRRFSTRKLTRKPCSTVKKNEIPRQYCDIRTYKTKSTAAYFDTAVDKSDVIIGDDCASTKEVLEGLTDNESDRFECEICKAKFRYNYMLQGHLRIHTDNSPYECEICKSKFTLKSNLKAHLRIHTGEKPYKCDVCEVRFPRINSLRYHLKTHTGEKPYECEICKVRFIQRYSLKLHLRTHTGEKPYECDTCKARFSKKAILNYHLRTHTGEKPYECEICNVRLSHKSYLKTHLNIHAGVKPYKCDTCDRTFTHKISLNRHLRRHR